MRGSTFVILAAFVIIGLLAYFYLLPKFRGSEEATAGRDEKRSGLAGAFRERSEMLEEAAGE